MRHAMFGVIVLTATALLCAPAQAQWTATLLHTEGFGSFAYDCDLGRPVGTIETFPHNPRAVVWNGAGPAHASLHPTGDGVSTSRAYASFSGKQAGSVNINNRPNASLWNGTAESWVNLNPSGAIESTCWDLCPDHQAGEATFVLGQPHAGLWQGSAETWTDLHPPTAETSRIHGTSGVQQVGEASVAGTRRASLWSGSADSWVSLHPGAPWQDSIAYDVHGGQQVGTVRYNTSGSDRYAVLWKGSVESMTFLVPPTFDCYQSVAYGIYDGMQVGYGWFGSIGKHPIFWSGTAESWVNLTEFLPGGLSSWAFGEARGIWADDETIYVVGRAMNAGTKQYWAFLWTRPRPLCPADVVHNWTVNVEDLLGVIGRWGPCAKANGACQADVNGDQAVDADDLLTVVSDWGSCFEAS